jgi:putative ABC transport system permease protein
LLGRADLYHNGGKEDGMSLLLGALTLGFIFSFIALGVYISFRIFDFPDITADGSSTLGAALTTMLLVHRVNPVLATAAGFAGGFFAGSLTGILATKFKINGLLAGILVMTGLYSVNLHIMGRSNISLLGTSTLSSYADRLGLALTQGGPLHVLGWEVTALEL